MQRLFLCICVLLVCSGVFSAPAERLEHRGETRALAGTLSRARMPSVLGSLISSLRNPSAHNYPKVSSSSVLPALSHRSSSAPSKSADATHPSASLETNSNVIVPGRGAHTRAVPKCYQQREVKFTQYWIPRENDWDESDDGRRVYLKSATGRQKSKALKDASGAVLASVSQMMFDKCQTEGTVCGDKRSYQWMGVM